ncbi:tannase/feruloyl esterase family alpha/beta hydrolase [Pseudomonas sp. HR96]|uniref:tannase/feruloyl esterase family alpha/beta hydrolase n=1 Tax=Pseudomonas sp. HR96 TaxID=1027966 RepID=UPI002A74B425|nr:tannase/feruloyl esterase family alpha/beta hydrolase [Pseudomonas sp. HR96]WPP01659.1 tannase/feruloyl esterase family alpha/beta hydrolase [Pseudomonas sp. HR96]
MKAGLLGCVWTLLAVTLPTLAAQAPLSAAPAQLASVAPVSQCADLASITLDDMGGAGSRIDSAREIDHQGTAVCEVRGNLAPTIGFQILLPTHSWTQRYLQIGCGGLCGRVSEQVGAAAGCAPLASGGFVQASTDMGHHGNGAEFGEDPRKRSDFAYRAVHLTAAVAKRVIQAYYGQAQRYAYFSGCSDGGREALMEAQRYPEDFNGVIAGAAALNFQTQNALYHAWLARSNTAADGKAIVTAARLPLLHEAVLKACDAADGQVDRLLSDPRACHFDPAVLQCADGQAGEQCLSQQEVTAVTRFYSGPVDPVSGKRLIISGLLPGSELAWAGVFVPANRDQPVFSSMIALQALQSVVFEHNPAAGFKLADLAFDQATFDRLRPLHALYDATNPDLSRFAAAGGKLIIWHGWADPHISPINSIAYHEAVQRQMGQAATQAFERLYLLPGVHHCAGGEGPSQMDLLTPMLAWVEQGQAPQAIIATQVDAPPPGGRGFGAPLSRPDEPGQAAPNRKGPPPGLGSLPVSPADAANAGRSRPLYPYPYTAVYSGQGDPRKADAYRPAQLQSQGSVPQWLGSDFFSPYPFKL